MDVKILTCFPLCGEWVCTLKTEYPFIRHIPIAIVMSISQLNGCAMIVRERQRKDTFLVLACTFRSGAINSRL